MIFQAGDTIVFYVRVKAAMSVETATLGQYDGLDLSGVFNRDGQQSTLNPDAAAATVGSVSSVFPGGISGEFYGWMGGRVAADANERRRTFNQSQTDISDSHVFDAHVWRISATLN